MMCTKKNVLTFILCIIFPLFFISGCSGSKSSDNSPGSSDSSASDTSSSDSHPLTGNTFQVSVDGIGYLVFESYSGTIAYGRSATIGVDTEGVLASADGYYLKVLSADSNGNIEGGSPTTIDLTQATPGTLRIDSDGVISADSGGTTKIFGQVVLARFDAPYFLSQISEGYIAESSYSGIPSVGLPTAGGRGSLSFGSPGVDTQDLVTDLSVAGRGYMVLDNAGEPLYSRANGFVFNAYSELIDIEGYRDGGYHLRGYLADKLGNITSTIGNLRASTSHLAPQPTQTVKLVVNLDSREALPASPTFDPTNPFSYNEKVTQVIYNSLGEASLLELYFSKAGNNRWEMYVYIDDVASVSIGAWPFELFFNPDGTLSPVTSIPFTVDAWNPANGAQQAPGSNFRIDISGSTQFGSEFALASIAQDGYPPSAFISSHFDQCGILRAEYTNNLTFVIGQLVLVDFSAPIALLQFDTDLLQATPRAGTMTTGIPCQGGFGAISGDVIPE